MNRNFYVVSFPGPLNLTQVEQVRDQIRNALGEPNAKVVILGDGAELNLLQVPGAGED